MQLYGYWNQIPSFSVKDLKGHHFGLKLQIDHIENIFHLGLIVD